MSEKIWDLSQMVEDTDPEKIIQQLDRMVTEAESIEARYKGKISTMTPHQLLGLLIDLDDHSLRFEGAADYCRLLYSSNSLDPIAKRLNEGVRKAGTRAGRQTWNTSS